MNRPHSIGCDHAALESLRLLELDTPYLVVSRKIIVNLMIQNQPLANIFSTRFKNDLQLMLL